MGDRTAIEWTRGDDGTPGATWNPVSGCSRVSPGCERCYAEALSLRRKWTTKPWTGPNAAENVQLKPHKLDEPFHWRRPRRVFVNSMSDLFHERVPDHYITAVFGVMMLARRHTFIVLTKRPARMRDWLRSWGEGEAAYMKLHLAFANNPLRRVMHCPGNLAVALLPDRVGQWPLPNVWLLASAEDQRRLDERLPFLLDTPAAVRGLSLEPLLGPITLRAPEVGAWPEATPTHPIANPAEWDDWKYWAARDRGVQWVVVGGESGPGARACDLAWIRAIVGQCHEAGVKVFVKQLGTRVVGEWGEHPPTCHVLDVTVRPAEEREELNRHKNGVWRLRDRKGADPAEWPEDLRVREFPV